MQNRNGLGKVVVIEDTLMLQALLDSRVGKLILLFAAGCVGFGFIWFTITGQLTAALFENFFVAVTAAYATHSFHMSKTGKGGTGGAGGAGSGGAGGGGGSGGSGGQPGQPGV
jgi:uncharacterized membrane protein YgcG